MSTFLWFVGGLVVGAAAVWLTVGRKATAAQAVAPAAPAEAPPAEPVAADSEPRVAIEPESPSSTPTEPAASSDSFEKHEQAEPESLFEEHKPAEPVEDPFPESVTERIPSARSSVDNAADTVVVEPLAPSSSTATAVSDKPAVSDKTAESDKSVEDDKTVVLAPVATEPVAEPEPVAGRKPEPEPVAVAPAPVALTSEPIAPAPVPAAVPREFEETAKPEAAVSEAVKPEAAVSEIAEPEIAEPEIAVVEVPEAEIDPENEPTVVIPVQASSPEQAPAFATGADPVLVAAAADPAVAAADAALVEDEVLPADQIPAGVHEPDDLTRIAGIGPKMAMALAAGGITTYEQLAATDEATLRAAITGAGMRLAPSLSTWPERARALAAISS